MLHYIGLTAGEAFVVGFVATFIITAQFWPRVGAWAAVQVHSRLHRRAEGARRSAISDK